MIRIPLLQPHLTGVHGVDADRQNNATGLGDQTDIVRVRDWREQAEELLRQTRSSSFQSLALSAEVKLEETKSISQDGPGPQRHTANVACQVLHELSTSAVGPLCGVLQQILEITASSIYSEEFATVKEGLTFDRITYFEVASKLEEENTELSDAVEILETELTTSRAELKEAREETEKEQRQVENLQSETAELREELRIAKASESKAIREAEAVKQELVNIRTENLQLADRLEQSVRCHDSPKDTTETEREPVLISKAGDANVESEQAECPAHESRATQTVEATLLELEMFLAQDPAPKSITLTTRVDSEGETVILPLGCGADVPRILRFEGRIPMRPLDAEGTRRLVSDILQQRDRFQAESGSVPLLSWLFNFFSSQRTSIREATKEAYNFLHACQTFCGQSPLINAFWLTIRGDVAEAACAQLDRFSKNLDVCLARLGKLPVRSDEEWLSRLEEMLQLFSPSRDPDEISLSVRETSHGSAENRDQTVNRVRFDAQQCFVVMIESCYNTLIKDLRSRGVRTAENGVLAIDTEALKATLSTQYLDQSDRILSLVKQHAEASFSRGSTDGIPRAFVEQTIRRHCVLSHPNYQELEQAAAYLTMVSDQHLQTVPESATLPEIA